MLSGPTLAEVTRADDLLGEQRVESVHTGHLAVVDAHGEVLLALGAPETPVFPRSAVKPFQAAASLELLADNEAVSSAELAVAWASHRGEPEQLDAVRGLLARADLQAEDLTCPPVVAEACPGASPSRLQHNCSGKHALFALAGQRLGCSGVALLDPAGALQRVVLDGLAAYLGPPVGLGVDGCGAPAVVVPLQRLARAFADLAVAPELDAVRRAGLEHPGLVGGAGRLESALLGAGVVAKVGAEGMYGVGFTAPDGRPVGLAITAADGAVRGVAVAVLTLLTTAGVVREGVWEPPAPLGGGRPVGVVRPSRLLLAAAERFAAGR